MTNIFADNTARDGLLLMIVISGLGILEPRIAWGCLFFLSIVAWMQP